MRRRKTAKVRENEREMETDHSPPTLHTHTLTHTLWSEVHLQFTLTITTPLRKRAAYEEKGEGRRGREVTGRE